MVVDVKQLKDIRFSLSLLPSYLLRCKNRYFLAAIASGALVSDCSAMSVVVKLSIGLHAFSFYNHMTRKSIALCIVPWATYVQIPPILGPSNQDLKGKLFSLHLAFECRLFDLAKADTVVFCVALLKGQILLLCHHFTHNPLPPAWLPPSPPPSLPSSKYLVNCFYLQRNEVAKEYANICRTWRNFIFIYIC
jgi:hypothetical protein